MADTKYLDPDFAQSLWQKWESFSDTTVPLLQSLDEATTDFLNSGLKGDLSGNLKFWRSEIFDGINGLINHVQTQTGVMRQNLSYAAEELCGLDLMLSQSYRGGEE